MKKGKYLLMLLVLAGTCLPVWADAIGGPGPFIVHYVLPYVLIALAIAIIGAIIKNRLDARDKKKEEAAIKQDTKGEEEL